jgi:hypothetical protein
MSADRPRLTVSTPAPPAPPELDNYGPPPPLTDYNNYGPGASYAAAPAEVSRRRSPSPTFRRSPSPRGADYNYRGPTTREPGPTTREPGPYVDRRNHRGGGGGGRGRPYGGHTGAPHVNPRGNYRRDDNANAAVVFDLLFAIPISVWHRHGFHPPMRFHEERLYFSNFYNNDPTRGGPA